MKSNVPKQDDMLIPIILTLIIIFGGTGFLVYIAFYQFWIVSWVIVGGIPLYLLLTIKQSFRDAVYRNGKRYGHYRD